MEAIKVKVLEDKKVKIKPIVRNRPFFSKTHDGRFMFSGCKEDFTLPFINSTNSLASIFGEGEQEEFERLLNRKKGDLSIYDRKNLFWAKFIVSLTKNETTLDLNNPVHALQFRVLKANKDIIAPSWQERFDRPSYKWAIIDEKTVIEEEDKRAVKMESAMDLFSEIKKSQTRMLNVLRLLEKKPARDANKEWLKKELTKVIAQIEKTAGMPNIDDFIKAASDPQASEKIFVLDAIEANIIKASGGEFREVDSGRLIGKSLQAAVDHYADPLYQEDKLLIEEKIKRSNR
jgi:hypothetical protein